MGKLTEIKHSLLALMMEYPKTTPLAKPVFDAAQVFKSREQWDDAYDFFNFLLANYPTTPYGLQSKVEIERMKKTLGPTYFAGGK
jgi:hypothetical protein